MSALNSITHIITMPSEFGGKWGMECRNTRFPLPTLLCSRNSEKVKKVFLKLKNKFINIYFILYNLFIHIIYIIYNQKNIKPYKHKISSSSNNIINRLLSCCNQQQRRWCHMYRIPIYIVMW